MNGLALSHSRVGRAHRSLTLLVSFFGTRRGIRLTRAMTKARSLAVDPMSSFCTHGFILAGPRSHS